VCKDREYRFIDRLALRATASPFSVEREPPAFTPEGSKGRQMNVDAFRLPRWFRWTLVAVVAGGIFYASVLDSPGSGVPSLGPLGIFGMDKWLHALAYAGLSGALAVALAPRARLPQVMALAVLLAVGYGVGIEFVQAPLPERYFSVADMAANAVGAVVAVLGWRIGVGFVGDSRSGTASET
jgi:VanZ family protein